MLAVLVVSAFGPYLYSGIRTEQLATYGLAATLFPLVWPRVRTSAALAVAVATWGAVFLVASISWLAPPVIGEYWPGDAVANLDNLLMPVAVVLATVSIMALDGDRERLLRRVSALVVIAMSANAVIATAQTRVNLDPYLRRWWSLTGEGTGATKVMTLDRYTGVLNQPALAGILYGIAAMCALYLLHDKTAPLLVIFALLTVGGTVAVSKAFFLVGLPVAAWHLFQIGNKGQQRFMVVTGVIAGAFGLALSGLVSALPQVTRVIALLPGQQSSLLSEYTGNRYGADATTTPIVGAVMDSAPVAGLGLRGVATSTDSAWVEVIVLAGSLGALALAALLITLVVGYLTRRRGLSEPERRLFAGVVAIVIFGSFGFPVLTGNRLVVVVWVLLTLLLAPSVARRAHPDPPAAPLSARDRAHRGEADEHRTPKTWWSSPPTTARPFEESPARMKELQAHFSVPRAFTCPPVVDPTDGAA